jgi:choline dehydrogenase-like flavoprotein
VSSRRYDVIIVGAGLGGGIAAGVLAEAGKRVLLLERGRLLGFSDIPRDHVRNHRLPLYGHNTGPELEGHPRVFVARDGAEHVVPPHHTFYHNNAVTVGGGARIWGMQAWRFVPADFQMAARYGVPAGSSLADWPIGYEDLAPYYDRAEREIGIAGEHAPEAHGAPRSRPFPMPPVSSSPQREWLARGASQLGWKTFTPPLALNSVPFNGRAACVRCGECIGFACPSDAKNGSHNTLLPRALATGRCELVTRAHAATLDTDASGRVIGVTYFQEHDTGRITRESASASAVVLAAGAIETARLLLLSTSSRHPSGIGNAHGQVGRHLQGHYYPGAYGVMPPDVRNDGLGPGVNIATTQFNHGNPGVIGGAMLANEFIKLPIIFWRNSLPPDLPRWGAVNKAYMRDTFSRSVHVQGPVQEIPSPDSRVTLDPVVRDKFGLPVVRLSGTTHPETLRTAEFMRRRAEEWLTASGAERVWSWEPELKLSAGQHQAGTCRMGNDPKISVTNSHGAIHGHDNLFVADGSPHVTNGGFNPALTIMALAFRTAEEIARRV